MHLVADAVFIMAVAAAAASLASVGGRFSRTLDVAAHFAPISLGAGLVASCGGLLAGHWQGAAAALLGGLASGACAVLIAPDVAARLGWRRASAGAGATIKVVQLNLWRWNVDVAATVAWLEAQAADIVVLEEVVDNAAGVPEALAQTYPHRQEGLRTGTRVLSRHANLDCGVYRARSTKTHATGAWATFDHPAGAFTVVGFQATWPIPPGLQQADSRDLARWLDRFDRTSLIVCGDFNSTPWSAALRRQDALFRLERRSRALLTWPAQPYTRYRLRSPLAFLALDHIYAGPDWETVSVRRGPRLGSDHLPVVAVLRRRAAHGPGAAGHGGRTGRPRPHEDSPRG
jgi:endonuclease/exonuclease/phosphatase (EEP) superfamily protein YafD